MASNRKQRIREKLETFFKSSRFGLNLQIFGLLGQRSNVLGLGCDRITLLLNVLLKIETLSVGVDFLGRRENYLMLDNGSVRGYQLSEALGH